MSCIDIPFHCRLLAVVLSLPLEVRLVVDLLTRFRSVFTRFRLMGLAELFNGQVF
jgi:hypothetical protein